MHSNQAPKRLLGELPVFSSCLILGLDFTGHRERGTAKRVSFVINALSMGCVQVGKNLKQHSQHESYSVCRFPKGLRSSFRSQAWTQQRCRPCAHKAAEVLIPDGICGTV